MNPNALDHIALWVSDRDQLAAQLVDALDVRIVDRTDRYTLVGASATAGKLTLFDSPSEHSPVSSQLVSVMLYDPSDSPSAPMQTGQGLVLTFGSHDRVAPGTPRHGVIGMTLRSVDPPIAAAEYCTRFGFTSLATHRDVAAVAVGGGVLSLVRERPLEVDQPMLNHLGLLVDDARGHADEASRAGVHVRDIVDAPNTLAVFVDGPEQVCLEYVEHKPEFALT